MPIKSCSAICQDTELLKDLKDLEDYIKDELNVRELLTTTAEGETVRRSAEPNTRELGKRRGKQMQEVCAAVRALTNAQLKEFESNGKVELCGFELSPDDMSIALNFTGAADTLQAESYNGVLAVFDMHQDEGLIREGLARELTSRVQRMRKAAGLSMEDEIEIFYDTADATLKQVITEHATTIRGTLRVDMLEKSKQPAYCTEISTSEEECAGGKITITITKACLHARPECASGLCSDVDALSKALSQVSFDTKSKDSSVKVSVGGADVTLEIGKHAVYTLAALLNSTST